MSNANSRRHPNECKAIQREAANYLDRFCTADRAREIGRHLSECLPCTQYLDSLIHLRRGVRALPSRTVPVNLAVSLRVAASRHHARRASRVRWWHRLQMWTINSWRPMAMPMAGGFATACVLFATILPMLSSPVLANDDAPAAWYQSAELSDLGPFGLPADHLTLDLTLDEQGRMIDYSVPDSESVLMRDAELRRTVENNLLFMRFKPAEFFGHRTTAKLRITIRRSQLDVKG
jgi:hypothetical protein